MGGGRWRLARAAAAQGRLIFWKVHVCLPMWGGGGIRENVAPRSPDIRLFAPGRFGGAVEVRGGGAAGARGLPGRWRGGSALGSSPSVEGAWLGAGTAEEGSGALGCEPDMVGVL